MFIDNSCKNQLIPSVTQCVTEANDLMKDFNGRPDSIEDCSAPNLITDNSSLDNVIEEISMDLHTTQSNEIGKMLNFITYTLKIIL